jgi:serine/threonine protein kinase
MAPMGEGAIEMPQQVGRYEVILPIAKGGMATVFLARTTGMGGFDRYLALKLTAPHLRRDPLFASHLIEEAKLVAHLRHTNVVQSFDVGECEDGVYLVMEYVPGDSFSGLNRSARAAGTRLPKEVGLRILLDALQGLHAAHEHADEDGNPLHLVHRDVSPHNILVGTDGISRLTDFGIAKAASRGSNTLTGNIKGKMTYMAPEQLRGDVIDRRCDVWAAGVIAWEILAGRKLYDKNDPILLLSTRPDPPRLKTVVNDVSDDLDDIVTRALRVDRDLRTETARNLLRELTVAARAASILADADEVAAQVARFAGPELAERKARLAQVRREQSLRPPRSAPDVKALIQEVSVLSGKRVPLPTLPEMPVAEEDDESELRIAVEFEPPSRTDRANTEILGRPVITVPDDEPSVFHSPVAPPVRESAPLRWLSRMRGGEADPDATAGLPRSSAFDAVLDTAKVWTSPPWTTQKVSVLAAIGGGVLGFILVLVAILGGKSKQDPLAARSSANNASAAPAMTDQPPRTAATVAPTTTDTFAEENPLLHVTANGPIASVRVADRVVDSIVPAPTVSIDLEDGERDTQLKIVVTSTDGRTATATAHAGEHDVEVTFGDKPRPPPAAATAPVRHPWQKHPR